MRSFVRVADTGRVLTIWLPENSSVQDLVLAIDASKQSTIELDRMELMCGAEVMQQSRLLMDYCRGRDNRVHIYLRRALLPTELLRSPFITSISPSSAFGTIKVDVPAFKLALSLEALGLIDQDAVLSSYCSWITLRDISDYAVDFTLEFDMNLRVAYLKSVELLQPNSSYTVYLDGDKLPLINDKALPHQQWAFKISSMPSLRLQCTIRDTESNSENTIIFTFHRQSAALIQELTQQLASNLKLTYFRIDSSSFRAMRLDGSVMELLTSRDLARLTEADTLIVYLRSEAEATAVANTVTSQASLPQAQLVDFASYKAEHWVNDASGYLVVCGKMSEAEENTLLLEVVAAFANNEDNRDNIGRNSYGLQDDQEGIVMVPEAVLMEVDDDHATAATAATAVTNVQVAQQLDDTVISSSVRSCVDWSSQVLFSASHLFLPSIGAAQSKYYYHQPLARELTAHMKQHGYAILQLPPDQWQAVEQGYGIAEEFFSLPLEQKLRQKSVTQRFLGYVHNPQFEKEFFQLRLGTAQSVLLQREDDERYSRYRQGIVELYQMLHGLASQVCRVLLHEGCGCEDEYISSLFEPEVNLVNATVSKSNLTLFRYDIPTTTINAMQLENLEQQQKSQCPPHSDIGFVTLIPLSKTCPGLSIFDWQRDMWMNMEHGVPERCVVAFTGEALTRLTDDNWLPSMHEVTLPIQEDISRGVQHRFSTPFQMCPGAMSVLDPSKVSRGEGTKLKAIIAGQFMDELSARRVSSNFIRR